MPAKESPPPKDPKRGLTRLFNIAPAEVSFVSSGANRRKFLFYKSSKGSGTMGQRVAKAELDADTRNDLADESFALPSERAYPIHDISHARNALARCSGKPEEAKVKAAVYKKYPSLKPEGVKKDDDSSEPPAPIAGGSATMSSVAKGGPGSGRKSGDGKGGGEKKEEPKVLGKTQSGKDIHEEGNKSTRGWSAQDHLDAFHAHSERGMDKDTEARAHPSYQAAINHGDHRRTPGEAMAIASDPKVRELGAQADKHHGIAEKHYQAYKKTGGGVKKSTPELMAKAAACMDGYVMKDADGGDAKLPDAIKAVGKAVVRIMAPMAGQMPADLAHKLLEMSGFDRDDDVNANYTTVQKSDMADDDDDDDYEDVEKKAMLSALKKASATYQEHLSKAGYGNGPKARLVMKLGGEPVKKSKGDRVSKSADQNAPDLSGLTPEVRERLEGVFKAQEELVVKNAALTTQNAELAKRIDGMQADNRKRELVVKASGYKNLALPQDQIVAQLEMADKAGKDAFELVCKNFDALDGQAREGRLFGEIGSPLPRGGGAGGDAWSRIEAAAQGWVAKSGKTMTKEQATAAFLESPEGQRLYAEHQAAREGGV